MWVPLLFYLEYIFLSVGLLKKSVFMVFSNYSSMAAAKLKLRSSHVYSSIKVRNTVILMDLSQFFKSIYFVEINVCT